ncbi:MAG: cardiolipin synthase [Bacillota bacterium]
MWFITFDLPIWIITAVIVLNISFLIAMIFIEQQNPDKFFKWGAVLLLLPFVGFVFYLFFGKGPSISRKKNVMIKLTDDKTYAGLLKDQQVFIDEVLDWSERLENFISYNINANGALLATNNNCELFTDMTAHYEDIYAEIQRAENYIHICYFIWRPDKHGTKLRDLLAEKAKSGVRVRVLYDDIGSLTTKDKFFNVLRDAGGEVYAFTPSKLRYFSRNMNYRNHRKILVIDGKVGYIGGANIGGEYLGEKKKTSPWRDSHLKVSGGIINALNLRFLQDYKFSTSKEVNFEMADISPKGEFTMQIISSGPDSRTPRIENTYIKAIYNARKQILIQTPYLILDEAFKLALVSAVNSGVKVSIMIPGKPDKRSVLYVTMAYAIELHKKGVEILIYDGFLHAKTMLVDDEISSVGTFNLDIRSFKLHYESTALIYGDKFANIMQETYETDSQSCLEMTDKMIAERGLFDRFITRIALLFSPLM